MKAYRIIISDREDGTSAQGYRYFSSLDKVLKRLGNGYTYHGIPITKEILESSVSASYEIDLVKSTESQEYAGFKFPDKKETCKILEIEIL